MGYTGVVGTAADKVKVWVPTNILLAAILKSPMLVSKASTSKRKRSSDNDGGASTSKCKCSGNNDGRASTSKGKHSGDNDSSSSGEGTVTSKGAIRHMKNRSTMGPGPASGEVIEISSSSDDEQLRNHQSAAKGWLGFLDLTTPEPEEGWIQTKFRGTRSCGTCWRWRWRVNKMGFFVVLVSHNSLYWYLVMSFFMNMWPCCPRERCFFGVDSEFALSIPMLRKFNGNHENAQSKKTEAIKK